MVSCQKGPACHAYAWPIGPFWQDTLDMHQCTVLGHHWCRWSIVTFSATCLCLNLFWLTVNTLRPRQNGQHFPDNISKWIFLNGNAWILIEISLKFVPKGGNYNMLALVQIMDWCWPGNKPLFDPKMVRSMVRKKVWQIIMKFEVSAGPVDDLVFAVNNMRN